MGSILKQAMNLNLCEQTFVFKINNDTNRLRVAPLIKTNNGKIGEIIVGCGFKNNERYLRIFGKAILTRRVVDCGSKNNERNLIIYE